MEPPSPEKPEDSPEQALAGVPNVTSLPMGWQRGLPEEAGGFEMAPTFGRGVSSVPPVGAELVRGGPARRPTALLTIAIVAYPRISNPGEFQALKNIPGVRLRGVRNPCELVSLSPEDWVVLPGSDATAADLAWLRTLGLDGAIARHAGRGGAVLGICGGLQMLGEALINPHGIDGNAPGLGLLPLVTVFAAPKLSNTDRPPSPPCGGVGPHCRALP